MPMRGDNPPAPARTRRGTTVVPSLPFGDRLAAERPMLEAFVAALLRGRPRSGDLAAELAQASIAVAWRRRGAFDQTLALGPWLRGIARRVTLAWVSREARRGRLLREHAWDVAFVAEVSAGFDGLEAAAGEAGPLAALRACLDGIPPEFGEVVRRHYWGGVSVRAVAASLRIDAELAHKRLQRARRWLADCIRRRIGGSDEHG